MHCWFKLQKHNWIVSIKWGPAICSKCMANSQRRKNIFIKETRKRKFGQKTDESKDL